MSFEKGSVSLRVFKVVPGSKLPEDVVKRLAKDAISPVDAIPVEGTTGWATGRHLLDRDINEDSVRVGGHLRLTLVKAERKIPAALFKAECRQEELAHMQATGAQYLKRAEKAAISKSVRDRMLPHMPPSLSGIDLVKQGDAYLTTAVSDSNADVLMAAWHKSIGQDIVPYTPDSATILLGKRDVRELHPTSFSPDVKDADLEQDIGTEFLTWLWYFSEACGGQHGDFSVAVEGPFTFVHEGAGAHEIVVRKGNPGIASEAKSALMAGKKLKKAKVTLAKQDRQFSCTFNGREWTFGSLKLPKSEAMDAVSSFQERVLTIGEFVGGVEELFVKFVSLRFDQGKWSDEVQGIKGWVVERVGKA